MARFLKTHIDDPARVGKRLRQARQEAGLTQRQLAFPGCTPAYLSRLEAGERSPSLQMIHELANRLSVAPHWLAKGAPTPRGNIDPAYVRSLERRVAQLENRLRKIGQLAAS